MPSLIRPLSLCAAVAVMLLAVRPASAVQSEDSANETVKRMTPELLWKLARLGEAAISKDGSTVAYTAGRYSIEENSGTTALHLLRLF